MYCYCCINNVVVVTHRFTRSMPRVCTLVLFIRIGGEQGERERETERDVCTWRIESDKS